MRRHEDINYSCFSSLLSDGTSAPRPAGREHWGGWGCPCSPSSCRAGLRVSTASHPLSDYTHYMRPVVNMYITFSKSSPFFRFIKLSKRKSNPFSESSTVSDLISEVRTFYSLLDSIFYLRMKTLGTWCGLHTTRTWDFRTLLILLLNWWSL